MKLAKALSALSFAHLLGISAAKAEDDEMKQRADESDEDYAKRMEDEDKKENEDDAKAHDEDDDANADHDEGDDDGKEEAGKAKKADESDDEDHKEKAARTAERARCAAIFASSAAAGRPDLAAHMAFNTDLPSADAIAMLSAVSAGAVAGVKVRSLASRMAAVQAPNVGTDAAAPAANSPQGVAARIVAAGKKRRGES